MIKRLTYFISLLILPSIPLAQHSLSFDGVNDYVNVGNTNSLAFNGSVSISAWVKFSNFNNSLAAVVSMHSHVRGYAIEKSSGENKLGFWVSDGTDDIEVRTNTLSTNTWYHIVGTNDGYMSKIYVNGSLINSTLFLFRIFSRIIAAFSLTWEA